MEIPREVEKRAAAMEIEGKKRGAAFKYGLVGPFLWKFPFEDREDVPASYYYDSTDSDSDGDDRPAPAKTHDPNTHEVVKRFLRQVRESNGYDVDCCPPRRLWSPFLPTNPNTKDERVRSVLKRAIHFSLGKINPETGKNYEFVKVENAVYTRTSLFLLTFTVKDTVDYSVETLRAMVGIPYGGKEEYTLEEWMYKPLPATATANTDPEKKKAKMGESTDLGSLDREIVEKIFSFLDNKSAASLSVTCKNCFSAWPLPSSGKS